MIKGLFFTVALLAPGLAYGGNPSGDLSVEVVPASPNGIACDIGPAYTGAVPPGAQAAGFTHCAANYDFTSSQFANPSTWLDVCGASAPLWAAEKSDGVGNPAPCSAWSITTDGALQVLQMHWDPSFLNNSVWTTGMHTTVANPQQYGNVQDFPEGAYWQATFRNTVGSFGTQANSGSPFTMAWWSWQVPPAGSSGPIELDWLEVYAYGAPTGSPLCGAVHCQAGTNGKDWGNGNPLHVADYAHPNIPLVDSYDPTVYQIVGSRVTNDGAKLEVCQYLNNQFVSCGGPLVYDANQVNNRSYAIMYDGPQANDGFHPGQAQDLYVKGITIFACANWRTGQCLNNPVLSGAP
jgi:hypothetical protein